MWGMGNGKCEGEGGAGGSRAMGCVLGGLQAARMGADGTGCEVNDLLAFQTALPGLLDDASYTHISVKGAAPRKLFRVLPHPPTHPPTPPGCKTVILLAPPSFCNAKSKTMPSSAPRWLRRTYGW